MVPYSTNIVLSYVIQMQDKLQIWEVYERLQEVPKITKIVRTDKPVEANKKGRKPLETTQREGLI